MTRKSYPSDLTDEQWKLIEPHVPPERWGGRTRSVDIREVINAIFYLVRSGCAWRAIPHDFPNWHTCRHYFDRFVRDGTWQIIHERLRASGVAGRRTSHRNPPPPSSTANR